MVVVVPKNIVNPDSAFLWIATLPAGCNKDPPVNIINADVAIADLMAHDAQTMVVVPFQVPNCKMRWKDDPEMKWRREDHQLAWSMKRMLDSEGKDPEQVLLFPMAKAVF